MRVALYGSGYVGLVTAACLADSGVPVLCVDIDADRIGRLRRGRVPIHEPGLPDLLARASASGRLRFTDDAREGVRFGPFQFIAVGTPALPDGSADLGQVLDVARSIGRHIRGHRIVAIKSTVPVGTTGRVRAAVLDELRARGAGAGFDVVSNPEFLTEGAAVANFMKPDRIVIGTDSASAADKLRALYEPFNRSRDRVIVMDPRSAELTKYAANAMLATRIGFMNEMANLAERLGADIEQVRLGIGADPRIGPAYLYPGCGYGGSCLPKDVGALAASAAAQGRPLELLGAVQRINERQRRWLFDRISAHFGADLPGRTIALWGLSFKPDTDDMRQAPSRALMEALWAAGCTVRAHDPAAMDEARRRYPDRPALVLCPTAEEAARGADALAVATEWRQYRNPDFARLRSLLRNPVVFDGRNLYDPALMARHGFRYRAVGRGSPAPTAAPPPHPGPVSGRADQQPGPSEPRGPRHAAAAALTP